MGSTAFVQALAATIGISLLSLIGIVFLVTRRWSDRLEVGLVSFAAGILPSAALLDLLPEAIETAPDGANVLSATLAGMVAFYLFELTLHQLHRDTDGHHAVPSRYLILIGDTLHNFIDGVAIGAAFLAGPLVGLGTTLAAAAHEIPQEIADYGILVKGRFSPRRALALNLLSGLGAVAGAIAVFAFGDLVQAYLSWVLAATAGMFLYIAAANLIPDLHHSQVNGRWLHALPFLGGVATMAALSRLVHAG